MTSPFNKKMLFIIAFISFIVYNKLENQEIKRILLDVTKDKFVTKCVSTNLQCECGCETTNRENFLSKISPGKSVLEIGPFWNPSTFGDKVKYFDIYNKNVLIEKAKSMGIDPSKTPHIDFIEPTGDLSVVKEKFDIIFSSHNIEHQVDLIRHLNQVANLMKDGSKFFIAIPDKRYSFDHFIPESPTSEVIASHELGMKTHSLQTILQDRCERGHNDNLRHWKGDHSKMNYENNPSCYRDALMEFKQSNGSYIDSHKWRFTPSSFTEIIRRLNELEMISLKIDKVWCTEEGSNEFYAILSK
jgi:hypothetical protein